MTLIPILLAGLITPAHASVRASSEAMTSDGEKHPAANAVDGRLDTAWAEGDDGDGTGSWLEVSLDRTTDVESISIWPGRIDRGSRGLREHGRPHTVTVTLSGAGDEVTVQQRVLDIAETGPVRLDVPIQGKARKVKITLDEVYAGGIYNQTYITELAVNFAAGAPHDAVQKLVDWRESDAGQKAAAQHQEEVAALVEAIQGEEFGGRDQFRELSELAAQGATYLRERAARVPDGFKMAAVPPSIDALNALLALEDPNATAALELAATRVTGKLEGQVQDRVSRMTAFAELKGGGKRNVVPFGEEGFSKGSLRSFREPLDLTIDHFGGVWIADTANHRVQRFDFEGIGQQTIGSGEPALSNQWLGRTRDWYVSGNTAAVGGGGFTLPVSLDLVPDKKNGDGLVVLDAAGQVTLLDANGKPRKSWSLGVESPLSPGVGGEGHVALAKNRVIVAWGNDGYVFDLEGNALNTFSFEDGVVGGLVGFKNGKFAAIFGSELVMFSTDGFRFGDILKGTVPDGYEYYDVALDQKGKLWVVTDTGYAVKYKGPGKVDYQVKLVDYSFGVPRADVYDDLVFVTDRDAFKKFDALELHAQQDAD